MHELNTPHNSRILDYWNTILADKIFRFVGNQRISGY